MMQRKEINKKRVKKRKGEERMWLVEEVEGEGRRERKVKRIEGSGGSVKKK